MPRQERGDLVVDWWMTRGRLPSGGDQRFDDLQLTFRIAAVARSPKSRTKHRAIRGLNVGSGAALEQQPHNVEMIAEDRIEERGLTVAVMVVDMHAAIDQEADKAR